MKKQLITIILLTTINLACMAQKGANQINIGFDAGGVLNEYYQTQFPAGFGASVKGLLGMAMNSQFSVSGHYLYFPINSSYIVPKGESISLHQIPVLIGYRVYRESFFFEPQVGAALLINSSKNQLGKTSSNDLEFAFSAEIGYVFNQLELSLRYQQSGGSPFQLAFLGARVAYVLGGIN